MKGETTTLHRGLATACLLAFGATVLGLGTASLSAQTPSPADTCGSYSGSTCMDGQLCILFFCWDWETNWRAH